MLINCKPGCLISLGSTTASLDIDSGEVYCDQCHEIIPKVSQFAKTAMRNNGDVYRRVKVKPLLFPCLACNAKVEVDFSNDTLRGKACEGNCSFTIPKPMISAMKIINKNKDDEGQDE